MSLLKVENLVVGYGPHPVLHGIDFEVEQGEVCVLLGLNGAGKTTTVSTIAGLLKPQQGRVLLDGKPLGRKSPSARVRQGIALCPEGRRVFPRLTVRQNLRLGAWTRRRSPKTVREQMDLVLDYFPRLADVADKLLWGTDWPGPMVPGMRENLDDFLALDLSEDVRRKLLQDNADRLFGPAPEV